MKITSIASTTLAQKEYQQWVKYFNSHIPYLTRQNSSGRPIGAQVLKTWELK